MHPEEAAKILKSLVDGFDPSSGEELPPDSVYQRANVIRALLVGRTAIEDALLRGKRRAQLPVRVGSAWTIEEDEQLRLGFQASQSIEALALSHERTPNAIRARLERLNLIPEHQRANFPRFPFGESTAEKPRRGRSRGPKVGAEERSESESPSAIKGGRPGD